MTTGRLLTPMMFDFLWEELELGEHPYPLVVPSHGRTMNERASLRNRVNAQLRTQGLKDPMGVDPKLAEAMQVLSRPESSVDAVHVLDQGQAPQSALAASDGEIGVLAVQDKQGVWLRPIFPDALVSEITGLLPPAERGTIRSVTIPLQQALETTPRQTTVLSRAAQKADTAKAKAAEQPKSKLGQLFAGKPEPEPERRRRSLSTQSMGEPTDDYAALLAEPRIRGGQIAANVRDDAGIKRRSPVLAWFDTSSGRYLSVAREGPDGADWISVAGADMHTLRTRLSELVSEVSAAEL